MSKIEFERIREFIKDVLGDHTAVIVNEMGHQKSAIEDLDKTIQSHNGRLSKVERNQIKAEGGRAVIKAFWGVFSVFFMTMAFGLFNMYVKIQTIDSYIVEAVVLEISKLEFQITE